MTSIATKLENDSTARARLVTIVTRLMAAAAGVSIAALVSLAYSLF